MNTRRDFIKTVGAAGAATLLPCRSMVSRAYAEAIPGGTLNPALPPKYVTPLVIPPAMPRTSNLPGARAETIDYYEIAVRQFRQQILPAGWPATTVWGYGLVNRACVKMIRAFHKREEFNGTTSASTIQYSVVPTC
jgi:hypothetical protein